MNQSDRQELERLKQQQAVLEARLSDLRELSSELAVLSLKIAALEDRINASEPTPSPSVAQLLAQKERGQLIPSAHPVQPEAKQELIQPLPDAPPVQPQTLTGANPLPPPSPVRDPNEQFKVPPPLAAAPPVLTPPTPPPPHAPEKSPFELRLGTYWLPRIGVVVVLTGLVLLANLAYKKWVLDMGPVGKVALLYFAGALLLALGGWLYRKYEPLKNYAQVLIAGGLAEVYFTTYAAHHLQFLRVIQSPVLDAVLLLAWAAFIVVLADWKKSEIMALLAIVLSFYDAVITRVGLFTLYSNLILATAALVFLIRNRWAAMSLISLIGTYAGYAFWRFFGPQGWHWANPEEGLWTGLWFLLCYWAIFTAAVFLCRQWPLPAGQGKDKQKAEARTSFLSLNNGAFFGLFVLTMFQVRQGGFWKISLGFGAVLIALAVLTRRLLPNEPLPRNGYLTQGLFLVTLGFIAKFTGTNLALVLAVESALLQVMSRLLRNQVLRFGSVVCAALATGWAVWSIEDFDRRGLIIGTAAGFFMIFNSWYRARAEDKPPEVTQKQPALPETIYFTILGLLIWGVGSWRNASPHYLALTLSSESVVFLLAQRWVPLLRFGSYVYAALAAGCGIHFLVGQIDSAPLAERMGLYAHAIVGILLIANALWESRSRRDWLFSGLGLIVWLVTTWAFTPSRFLAPVLAFEALLFTAQRLPAVAIFGQGFLFIAQWQCAGHLVDQTPLLANLPWWNPALVIAITVALSHWWQRRPEGAFPAELQQVCQVFYALATVGVLFFWLRFYFSPPGWLAFTCVLAGALTVYGLLTRLWFVAGFGQLFLLASVFEFFRQVPGQSLGGTSPRLFALAPIAALWVLSLAVLWWHERNQAPPGRLTDNLKWLGTAYRALAVILALGWIFEYVSPANRFWVLALIGGLFFLWCIRKPRREAFLISAVFTLIGFTQYWQVFHSAEKVVYWPNLLSILGLLVQQRLARRKMSAQEQTEATENEKGPQLTGRKAGVSPEGPSTKGLVPLPESVHTAMILLGGCSLWIYVGQLVKFQSGGTGFFLTAAWAALALVIFIAGFLFRERVYRWFGLGILAAALGRVVVVDVWQLETAYRILSFLALGVVLLVLGFMYTKYQESIRKWL